MPAIDADRHRTIDRHAAHDARLVAVIIDGLVLRRAIVQITVDQRHSSAADLAGHYRTETFISFAVDPMARRKPQHAGQGFRAGSSVGWMGARDGLRE